MLITVVLFLIFLWLYALKKLAGPDLSDFDTPVGELFSDHSDDDAVNKEFLLTLSAVRQRAIDTRSPKKGLAIARDFAHRLSEKLESDCEFQTVVANGVNCEWCVAPDADPKRRLLFIHGGAFVLGSPQGHRLYAHKLSHLAKAAVLSVDYRLLPENSRMASCIDVQNAYHWILSQGPDGTTPLDTLLVAGDSAGGSLALMVSAWSKTKAARMPDATLAFSPSTDTTLASPTIATNAHTDPVIGQPLGMLHKVPQIIALWIGFLLMRCKPNNDLVSPLFGDLSNLPPTLIQASSSEVLLGDAVRYTNKAQSAGSKVQLQIWENQIHDWQLFSANSGSGKEAWEKAAEFIGKFS